MATKPELLAYYDTLTFGLIPCRIVGYEPSDYHNSGGSVVIELTASRGLYGAFKRGQRINASYRSVVSRKTFQRFPHTYVHTIDHDAARRALAS